MLFLFSVAAEMLEGPRSTGSVSSGKLFPYSGFNTLN